MRIAGTGTALPRHYYPQSEIVGALKEQWANRLENPEAIARLYSRMRVNARSLAMPLESYERHYTWGEFNDIWIQKAQELGDVAISKALASAGIGSDQLGAFFFVSVTGVASPSIDARLINRMGLPPDIKRVPIFGLGCVGGAAGIARAADYVKAYPDQAAVLLSVELCSLTWQRDDLSTANVISSGLFGDGAAAVIITGKNVRRSGPEILATRSIFYPDSERLMGWDISEAGFRIVLSPDVPKIIRENLGRDVDDFLKQQGLCKCEIGTWIMHTGGPKVLEATESALQLPENALEHSWECLRAVGNLSSTSVLLVLESFMLKPPQPGTLGLLAAMGPGFCSELVLIRW
jgi:alkylresorcinol/alkylpyrone synthase